MHLPRNVTSKMAHDANMIIQETERGKWTILKNRFGPHGENMTFNKVHQFVLAAYDWANMSAQFDPRIVIVRADGRVLYGAKDVRSMLN